LFLFGVIIKKVGIKKKKKKGLVSSAFRVTAFQVLENRGPEGRQQGREQLKGPGME